MNTADTTLIETDTLIRELRDVDLRAAGIIADLMEQLGKAHDLIASQEKKIGHLQSQLLGATIQ
jgi:hypothetical protein